MQNSLQPFTFTIRLLTANKINRNPENDKIIRIDHSCKHEQHILIVILTIPTLEPIRQLHCVWTIYSRTVTLVTKTHAVSDLSIKFFNKLWPSLCSRPSRTDPVDGVSANKINENKCLSFIENKIQSSATLFYDFLLTKFKWL